MTNEAIERIEPRGIGGWLILPAIGTVISPFIAAYSIFETAEAVAVESVEASLRAYIVVEVIVGAMLFVGWTMAVVWLFQKNPRFPRAFIALSLATVVLGAADLAIAAGAFDVAVDPSDIKTLVRSIANCVIWCPYMLVSKRVKNTFG